MRPLKLTFLLTVCTLLSLTVRGQEQHRIEGLVLDSRNNPIKGITVRIYRGSQPIKEVITGQDGAYSLSFYQGNTITTIEYYGSEWNPTTITNVSGAKSHTINKVLNRLGTVASYEQGAELLSSLDQLYFIARKNNVPFSEFTRRYGAAIAAARQTSMPTVLRPEMERREYLYAQNRYDKYQVRDLNFYPYPSPEFAEAFPSSTSSIDFAQRSSNIELGFQRGVQEILIDVDRPFDEDLYTIALYADGSDQPIVTQVVRQPKSTKVVRLRFRRQLFKPNNKHYQLVFQAGTTTFKVPITVTVE